MRAVNLLPRDLEQKRKTPPLPIVVTCGLSVVVAGVLAFTFLQASSAVGKQTTALAAAQAELAETPAPAPPPASVTALPNEQQQRTAVLSTVLGQRVAWDRVLREISLVLPDDVWLTHLDAAAPTSGATSADDFHLTGYTYSQASVARLLARLAVIPDLTGVVLDGSNAGTIGTRPVVTFQIAGVVRLQGVTS